MTEIQKIYLICEPVTIYNEVGKLAEHGEQVLFAFLSKENALFELKRLNKSIEEEEGDIPYFIKTVYLSDS